MELRRCPYDAMPIELERVSAEAVLVRCENCGARWEWHNAHIRRIEEPSVDAVRARRARMSMQYSERAQRAPGRVRAHVRR